MALKTEVTTKKTAATTTTTTAAATTATTHPALSLLSHEYEPHCHLLDRFKTSHAEKKTQSQKAGPH